MPLPRAVPVTLAAAERTTLSKRARGAKTAHRDRLRAQIVLAAARGRDNAGIAAGLRITADTVRKWRGRFAARGLDGLAGLPRSGRPRRISELTRAAIVALACQLPATTGVPLSRWTGPELLAEVTRAGTGDELSVPSVRRILAKLRSSPGSTGPGSPRDPGLRSQGGRDLGPYQGYWQGTRLQPGDRILSGRHQALHPGPRPLPPHHPGRARQARTGRARIRPPRRPRPAGRARRPHRESVRRHPATTGIAPFMDLMGQVMSRPALDQLGKQPARPIGQLHPRWPPVLRQHRHLHIVRGRCAGSLLSRWPAVYPVRPHERSSLRRSPR